MKREIKDAFKDLCPLFAVEGIALVSSLILSLLAYKGIHFDAIKDVLSMLQTISAAVFTIIGLWLGFIYPNAITSIVNDDISYISSTKDAERVESLVYIIIISAVVMLSTLLIYLFKALAGNSELYLEFNNIVKPLCISAVIYLCWLQFRCVLNVILNNFKFISNLHSKLTDAKHKHNGGQDSD